MKNKPACNHYVGLKKENLSNQLKSTTLSACSNAKKQNCESDVEKWLCLLCGSVVCSRNSVNQCSLKHVEDTDHNMSISLTSLSIWCYKCDEDFEIMAEECVNKAAKDKMERFQDDFKKLIFDKVKASKLESNKSTQAQGPFFEQKQQQVQQFQPIQQVSQVKQLNYVPKVVFGLKNLGNTCFFNSIMQCMNGATHLNQFYLNVKDYNFSKIQFDENWNDEEEEGWSEVQRRPKTGKKSQASNRAPAKSINVVYQNFLGAARSTKGNVFEPMELLKSVSSIFGRFRTMAQQDAQELLRCFLDGLQTGEERFGFAKINKIQTVGKPKKTIVENVFGSYLCNYLECLECGYISRTFDFCLDYVLPIRKPKQLKFKQHQQLYSEINPEELVETKVPYLNTSILVQKNPPPKASKSVEHTLSDCLEAFTEFEELNLQRNYFKCERCDKNGKKSIRAMRRFYFYDLPMIVTVVLKRFQQKSAGRFEKVCDHVAFPETIDLSDYTLLRGEGRYNADEIGEMNQDKSKYSLFGVVVHQGTMCGGHYVAYVKHREQNEDHWFFYSDTNFKEVSLKQVLQAQAYILFYEKS